MSLLQSLGDEPLATDTECPAQRGHPERGLGSRCRFPTLPAPGVRI